MARPGRTRQDGVDAGDRQVTALGRRLRPQEHPEAARGGTEARANLALVDLPGLELEQVRQVLLRAGLGVQSEAAKPGTKLDGDDGLLLLHERGSHVQQDRRRARAPFNAQATDHPAQR